MATDKAAMYTVERVEVWAGELEDRPGELAGCLEALARGGVRPECVILRPCAPLSGTGVLYISPVVGEEAARAARNLGMRLSKSMCAVRVAGPDDAGLLVRLARVLAFAGLNVDGLSSSICNGYGVHFLRFHCDADADRGIRVLRGFLESAGAA